MRSFVIPDPETLRNAIQASHERCRQFGVNPNEFKNISQKRLTGEELAIRREQNRGFLDIAVTQIKELYQFVAGAGFALGWRGTKSGRKSLLHGGWHGSTGSRR